VVELLESACSKYEQAVALNSNVSVVYADHAVAHIALVSARPSSSAVPRLVELIRDGYRQAIGLDVNVVDQASGVAANLFRNAVQRTQPIQVHTHACVCVCFFFLCLCVCVCVCVCVWIDDVGSCVWVYVLLIVSLCMCSWSLHPLRTFVLCDWHSCETPLSISFLFLEFSLSLEVTIDLSLYAHISLCYPPPTSTM
jgi:hypothetical protein